MRYNAIVNTHTYIHACMHACMQTNIHTSMYKYIHTPKPPTYTNRTPHEPLYTIYYVDTNPLS